METKAAKLFKVSKTNPIIKIVETQVKPVQADEVLVKVLNAGVNPVDNLIAHDISMKIAMPYKLPQTLGNEFVGEIEQVGSQVTDFKVGDRIFARNPLDDIGAFTQKLVIKQNAIAKVPEYLTNSEAAAVPLTALTAMQALELMDVKPGQSLFIAGGTGSFGAMAIPLAVAKGLKVIVNGSSAKKAEVEKLGVSQFIDYKKENYWDVLSNVDFVIDALGGDNIEKEMSIMKPGGVLVSLIGTPNKAFAKSMGIGKIKTFLLGAAGAKMDRLAKKYGVSYRFILVRANGKQLQEAAEILAQKQIRPALGDHYPLDQAQQAMQRVAQGHNKGKVILDINE
ncbi:NADP-dependent oxidoreductase [Lactobacillus sp. PV037]|uniref:NADP-dependent oxidoreductase n=1 Tax=unclassified Lactobacillus TaxID=2620435 RepID=UPI00223EBDEC|nr:MULTISPECIES: NADP-dependent oxidoreductase [unclassified Lactobacillus]QNQ81644.1 NADP-dependent oxidoreductase [Lactobacillus sp. PV012]QNQ84309.1 NADP-dependent oxidoreductase [Lactobacillus sp. PV037]